MEMAFLTHGETAVTELQSYGDDSPWNQQYYCTVSAFNDLLNIFVGQAKYCINALTMYLILIIGFTGDEFTSYTYDLCKLFCHSVQLTPIRFTYYLDSEFFVQTEKQIYNSLQLQQIAMWTVRIGFSQMFRIYNLHKNSFPVITINTVLLLSMNCSF